MSQRQNRPRTVGELLSDLLDRVRRIEQRTEVGIGSWVVTEDAAGQLVATHAVTGTVVVLGVP